MSKDTLSWVGIGALGVALVLAIVVQFVPWYTMTQTMDDESAFGGLESTVDMKLWEMENQGSSMEWSDPEADDTPGIDELRAGGPLVVTGLVLAFVAMVLVGVSKFVDLKGLGLGGAGAAIIAAILLMVGLIVYTVGVGDLFDAMDSASGFSGFDFESSPAAGLFVAIVMVVFGFVGAALSTIPAVAALRK